MSNKCPKIKSVLKSVRRIIAIGDIHGDFEMLVSALLLAKVIDKNNNWIGKDTVVVQVGDQIDRCRPSKGLRCNEIDTQDDEDSDYKIIAFTIEINQKALTQGGAFISLLGNHEIMNMQGILEYVSKKGLNGYGGIEGRRKAFERGGEISKLLACTRTSVLIIGSNLFVHGGLLPELLEKYDNDIDIINDEIRGWILRENDETTLIGDLIISPFWTREYGDKVNCSLVDATLSKLEKKYKIKTMVVGHTPQPYVKEKKLINSVCDGKVFRIDIGGSRAFYDFKKKNYSLQVLEVLNDNQYNILSEKDRMVGGNKKYHLVKK